MAKTGSKRMPIGKVDQVALTKAMQEIPQLMQDNPGSTFHKACGNIAAQFNISISSVTSRYGIMVINGKVPTVQMQACRTPNPDRKKFFRLLRAILQDETIEERNKILESQFGVDNIAKLCEKLAEYSLDSEKADSITSQYYRIKQES
ncbi:MAG: hypothetical protein OEY79_03155, partial [Anaplasmataceae bacterium]|nr:hypothetical protein [Anaplasmataceae bacterium]